MSEYVVDCGVCECCGGYARPEDPCCSDAGIYMESGQYISPEERTEIQFLFFAEVA